VVRGFPILRAAGTLLRQELAAAGHREGELKREGEHPPKLRAGSQHERHRVGDARLLTASLKSASRLMSAIHLSVWRASRRSPRARPDRHR
jgi:hypothetical protein